MSIDKQKKAALERAIRLAGSRAALARLAGVTKQAARQWQAHVPAERCVAIEEALGGRVTRYELRPDVFGPDPAAGQEVAP